MCGRFMLDGDIEDIIIQYKIIKREVDDYNEVSHLVAAVCRNCKQFPRSLNKGEIYPSQKVPIILDDSVRTIKSAVWGFPLSGNSKLVINARSESIADNPMFKNAIHNARCIIPANLFYEWKDEGNKNKVKHEIYLKEKRNFSFGGLFKFVPNDKGEKELSFVIMTTKSNRYMKDLHSRMPLIIHDDAFDYWLDNRTSERIIEEIYKANAEHELIIERMNNESPFEQMKLF